MQNIKKAGLIKEIQLKEKDIFDKPDLGKFDAIPRNLLASFSVSSKAKALPLSVPTNLVSVRIAIALIAQTTMIS